MKHLNTELDLTLGSDHIKMCCDYKYYIRKIRNGRACSVSGAGIVEDGSEKIITGFQQEGERHEYTCYWEWF